MLSALDTAVGRIARAVKGRRDNTLLVFMSDNGARNFPGVPPPNAPLRGGKGELYEGGTRVPGLVAGRGRGRYSGLFHMVDWAPTLLALAGALPPQGMDGLDQSTALWQGGAGPRTEMVYNLDEGGAGPGPGLGSPVWQVGVRRGELKLVWGNPAMLKREGSQREQRLAVVQLFNLTADPGEQRDLAARQPGLLTSMQDWAVSLMSGLVPAQFSLSSHRGEPANLGGQVGCLTVQHCLHSGQEQLI